MVSGGGSCQRCGAGTYSPTAASTTCLDCPSGMVASSSGRSSCESCGAGARAVLATPCDTCPDNFFVSDDGLRCEECPTTGVTCTQGLLTVNTGYWAPSLVQSAGSTSASNITSDTRLYKCPIDDACQSDTQNVTCESPRTGTLCALCEDGYVLVLNECQLCGSTTLSWLLLLVAVIVLVVVVSVMVWRAMAVSMKTCVRRDGLVLLWLLLC